MKTNQLLKSTASIKTIDHFSPFGLPPEIAHFAVVIFVSRDRLQTTV